MVFVTFQQPSWRAIPPATLPLRGIREDPLALPLLLLLWLVLKPVWVNSTRVGNKELNEISWCMFVPPSAHSDAARKAPMPRRATINFQHNFVTDTTSN